MKKIFSYILTFIIVLGLSGCTDADLMETRLDELELHVEELQTELDAKDELLDTITSNIANLNDSIYDDASVTELIEDLQLWQENHNEFDTEVWGLLSSLLWWKDSQDYDGTVYDADINDYILLYDEEEFQIYILEEIPDAQLNVGIFVEELDNEWCFLEITTTNAYIVKYDEEYISLRKGVLLDLFDTYDLMEYGVLFQCHDKN